MVNLENIIQWNCNGCKTHYCELKSIILERSPIIICLQETHLKPKEPFSLRGYRSFRHDVLPNIRARAGVAIFIKDNIPSQLLNISTNLQAVCVEILYPSKINVCNLYLPDNSWNADDLTNLVSQIPSPFILLGDFNAHHTLWGGKTVDTRGRSLEKIIDEQDLIIINTGKGTYLNSRSRTYSPLDLTFCSPTLAPILRWNVLEAHHDTDHLPVIIEFATTSSNKTQPERWLLERANWNRYQNMVTSFQFTNTDVNHMAKELTQAITVAAESTIPRTSTNSRQKKVPWWNKKIAEAVKRKKQAFNIFKKHPSQEHLINFKRLRAKARNIILESKRKSWKEYISTISPNTPTPEVWRKIRSIGGRRYVAPTPILLVNNVETSDTNTIANELANHFQFTSSSANYDQHFINIKPTIETQLDFNSNIDHTYNAPFTRRELEDALASCKNSSPGPDKIPYEFLKQLPPNQKENLLNLYNKIWLEGEYPEQWKEAHIIPLLKPNKNPILPSSHRPISLTCCKGKLLEKMVCKRLKWILQSKNLLCAYQTGFQSARSTTDNLVLLENSIQDSFANRNHHIAIFFDLEKAFDMTWRFGILKKLHDWGLQGKLPRFIQNFLCDRTFQVKINNVLSVKHIAENGIPQGSSLSVLLFVIAVNNIVECIDPTIGRCMYVDDLVIFYSASSIDDIENKLQNTVNAVLEEANRNGFKVSRTKTKAIHFCRLRKSHHNPNLVIQGTPIEFVDTYKFLGVILDKKLRWTPHIEYLSTKCKKAINIIRTLSNLNWGCDREILIRIYKTLVLSRLDYGAIVYGGARKTKLKILDSIQGTALRLALGAFRTSPLKSLNCETNILPLSKRREQLLLNYAINVWYQPHHLNYKILFDEHNRDIYINRPTISKPASVRVQDLLRNYSINLPAVYTPEPNDIAPWSVVEPKINLSCNTYTKNDTHKSILKSMFWSVLEMYPGSQVFYTDGSKTVQGVGSAVFTSGNSYSWTLPHYASIFTAELYAIWQSIQLVKANVRQRDVAICSDSLSALQALSKPYSADPLIQSIITVINELSTKFKKAIRFIWVPGHIGISGNEQADQAARQATENDADNNIPTRHLDIKAYAKTKILHSWQQEWTNDESRLKLVKQDIKPWKFPIKLNKREQVAITRLKIEHTRITGLFILRGHRQPRCEICDSYLTVSHLLIYCSKYEPIRRRIGMSNELNICLNNEIDNLRKLILFLHESNLIKEI